MSWVAVAVAGGGALGGYLSGEAQKSAAVGASQVQQEYNDLAIEEQRRQFEAIQKLLEPYISAGNTALTEQLNLMGLGGQEAQQSDISAIEESPQFKSIVQQGENALLQQASATGGLRGGNTQAALAQYRPQILSGLITQRLQDLGGLSRLGQASAGGNVSAAQNFAANAGNLLQSQGAARAGEELAVGQAGANQISKFTKGIGTLARRIF